jgi:hypothetical protein
MKTIIESIKQCYQFVGFFVILIAVAYYFNLILLKFYVAMLFIYIIGVLGIVWYEIDKFNKRKK